MKQPVSHRRRISRALLRILAAAAILTVLAGIGGYAYALRSLPQVTGLISLPGLRGPVSVIRDSDAVPHIYAENRLDLYIGLGYVHAQDRLWQMEYQRRAGQGRLSEILGQATLAPDRFLRTLGVYRAAQRDWDMLGAAPRAVVTAYITGINAFIDTHSGSRLPPEFALLGFAPEPWTGPDVLVWIKMLALDLGGDNEAELLQHDLVASLGAERARQLMPADEMPARDTSIPAAAGARLDRLAQATNRVREIMDLIGMSGEGLGSNAWVVSGAKSSTGKPLLANDPHLTSRAPLLWYQAHLAAGDFEVVGATIPGLPGVVIGRNRRIAWGITNFRADVQDFYRERLDPGGQYAEFDGQMEPMQLITETIKVRGRPDVQQIVRVTRHGPLISDAINEDDAQLPDAIRPPPLEPLALRWTALDRGDTTIEAFIDIDSAQNWQAFTGALGKLVAPAQNFVYADVDGNIGFYAPGRIPIRAGYDGFMPAEGWSSAQRWDGWIPIEALPHAFNPPSQMIVSANNRPVAESYPYFLQRDWAPYRAERIAELLEAKAQLGVEDFAAIQNDLVSLQARQLLPLLLRLVQPDDTAGDQALELLRAWDGSMQEDSAAAAIWAVWFSQLSSSIAGDELGDQLTTRYQGFYAYNSAFLYRTLQHPDDPWCDDLRTAPRENCRQIAERALRAALNELHDQDGSTMISWRWGTIHRARFAHVPFDTIPVLGNIFSRSIAHGGDWSTVNVGPFTYTPPFVQSSVAGYRQIIDLSRTDNDRFIIALGQSGHVLSPHYDDYLVDWQMGRYRRLRMGREEIQQAQQSTLLLRPASP